MPRIPCTICNSVHYAKPFHIAKGWGKYCSKRCQYLGQKTGSQEKCTNCTRLTYRKSNELSRSPNGKFFCSKSCHASWRNKNVRFGVNHGNWSGGIYSYRTILKRTGLPQVCSRCKLGDTRILAVHHKDKNRTNNNASNLLWMCHNCHYMVHHHPEEAKGYIVSR